MQVLLHSYLDWKLYYCASGVPWGWNSPHIAWKSVILSLRYVSIRCETIHETSLRLAWNMQRCKWRIQVLSKDGVGAQEDLFLYIFYFEFKYKNLIGSYYNKGMQMYCLNMSAWLRCKSPMRITTYLHIQSIVTFCEYWKFQPFTFSEYGKFQPCVGNLGLVPMEYLYWVWENSDGISLLSMGELFGSSDSVLEVSIIT